eukprot:1013355-Amphidinium_carterae.1
MAVHRSILRRVTHLASSTKQDAAVPNRTKAFTHRQEGGFPPKLAECGNLTLANTGKSTAMSSQRRVPEVLVAASSGHMQTRTSTL